MLSEKLLWYQFTLYSNIRSSSESLRLAAKFSDSRGPPRVLHIHTVYNSTVNFGSLLYTLVQLKPYGVCLELVLV